MFHVFAYGSNMLIQRMRDRVLDAEILGTGYIGGRKFSFHKRSGDGSVIFSSAFRFISRFALA